MNAAKPCAGCKHVRYVADEVVHACLHPHVAEPSSVKPRVLIGINAAVLRNKGYSMGKRQCGPDGLWFEAKPAQDPTRVTT